MKLIHSFLVSSLMTAAVAADSFPGARDPLPEPSPGSVRLPQPVSDGPISLEKALRDRRSLRRFKNSAISLAQLSQLLWAAQGVSGTGGRRTAPSAGALYPLEVYAVAGMVSGLSVGVYAYDPNRHALRRIAEGDAREDLSSAALGQAPVGSAAAVLVICAVYERTTVKYGERGVRYVHMEAGHAAQNVHLQAAALGLGTVVIGAFDDDGVRKVLRMTDREHPLYLMPVGRP
jgi:SagB-type dehydrogenase family enzyme